MQLSHVLSFLAFALLTLFGQGVIAQINDTVVTQNFYAFRISSHKKTIAEKEYLLIEIAKNGQLIISDSVITEAAKCTGFSVPSDQPFKNYFIFSKRERNNGKTYILASNGDFTVVEGGTFWAGTKHDLLFILAEREYSNIIVFSLSQMKPVFEKFNCDQFTSWDHRHGSYFGTVEMECGKEPRLEKEINEWMHPIELEQFDPKSNSMSETHATDEQVKKAQKLAQYGLCK